MTTEPARLETLSALARKVLWLSSWTIHHANHIRPNVDGLMAADVTAAVSIENLKFSRHTPIFWDNISIHALE